MTDKELQKLIDLTIDVKNAYYETLEILEEEYRRRFNNYPSDVDDNNFIDTFHLKQRNKMTVKDLTFHAEGRTVRN